MLDPPRPVVPPHPVPGGLAPFVQLLDLLRADVLPVDRVAADEHEVVGVGVDEPELVGVDGVGLVVEAAHGVQVEVGHPGPGYLKIRVIIRL